MDESGAHDPPEATEASGAGDSSSNPAGSGRHGDLACIFGSALVALVVYVLTASRTVYVGDSGELAAAMGSFGIAHPSGYPLYTIVGGLFTNLLPVGSPAFAANLFSSVCAAAAVGMCVALVLDWVSAGPMRRPAAVGAALLLAFSTAFWQEATVARVYALNAGLSMAVFWAAGRWAEHGTRRWALVTGAVAGCAMAHHLAAVGAIAGGGFLVLLRRKTGTLKAWWTAERVRVGQAALAGLPGLAFYLWLPVRFASRPEVRWETIDSLGSWLGYVGRGRYAGRSWTGADPVRITEALAHGLGVVAWEFWIVGGLLAAYGFAALKGRRDRWMPLLAFALVFGLLFVTHGDRRNLFLWDRYWMPWTCLGALGVGLGWARLGVRLRVPAARWGAVLALPVVCVAQNWHRCDRSGAVLARDHALKVLEMLPKECQFTVMGDDNVSFPLLYYFAVEGRRPDVMRFWRGQYDVTATAVTKTRLRAGLELWGGGCPDLPPNNKLQVRDDPWGLLAIGRLETMPAWPAQSWERWAIPSFEQAPPPAQVYESHERELLTMYFAMKARTLGTHNVEAGDAALRRAREYAAGNEHYLQQVWFACKRLGRGELQRQVYLELRALNERSARQLGDAPLRR